MTSWRILLKKHVASDETSSQIIWNASLHNVYHHAPCVLFFLWKIITFNLSPGNTNLLLTDREGRTEEYWPEVVAVRTERSAVRT